MLIDLRLSLAAISGSHVDCRTRKQRRASDLTACSGYDEALATKAACEPTAANGDGMDAWLLPAGLSSSAGLQDLQNLGMSTPPGQEFPPPSPRPPPPFQAMNRCLQFVWRIPLWRS